MPRPAVARYFLFALLFAAAPFAHARSVDVGVAAVPGSAEQLVLVVTPDWNASSGVLRTYARVGGHWHFVDEMPVTVGRSGAAWGLGLHAKPSHGPVKREGDGRAPAGVFDIGIAFGYEAG